MYQALYRKWRPKTFADVVGQQHITNTLRSQLVSGHLSHAYLFTGTRGTGKTTCAKILSRAVNCEHPVYGDPCNQCAACRGILDGSILDVTEIDAASNNGVDNIREIRDETQYTPASVKKRVYIIDEVHMLSQGAFNALLKTLEEPPEHVLFILATTEIHKVPVTILSRCQRFDFRRISPGDIERRLLEVAGEEQIPLAPDGAKAIARLSDGALRDALSILDRAASGTSGRIDEAAVSANVGILAGDSALDFMHFLLKDDLSGAIEKLSEFYVGGRDLAAVFDQLLGLIRDMLLVKTALHDVSALLSPAYSIDVVKQLCGQTTAGKLVEYARILQESLQRMNRVANKRVEAELTLVQLCTIAGEDYSNLLGRMEALEDKVKHGVIKQAEASAPAAAQDGPPPLGDEDAPAEEDESVIPKEAEKPPKKQKKEFLQDPRWKDFISGLSGKINVAAFNMLSQFSKGFLNKGQLVILADDFITCQCASAPDVKAVLEKEAQAFFGQSCRIKIIEEAEAEESLDCAPVDAILERAKSLSIELEEI